MHEGTQHHVSTTEQSENELTMARHDSANKPGDRLPPHSPEAEAGVLGCVLLDPRATLPECVAHLKGQPVFYDLRHQTIFNAMVEMTEKLNAIDVITLQQYLKDRDLLDKVGGIAFLADLPNSVPSAANVSYYLNVVWEKYLLRQMVQACTEAVADIYDYQGEGEEILDRVEARVLEVNDSRSGPGQRTMGDLVDANGVLIENLRRGVGMIGGIRTYLGYFDKMTGGLHRREMVVLAGRPSTGKTSLLVTILANLAKREKMAVGLFSMEMSAEDIVLRMMCSEAEVNFHKIRTGFPEDGDTDKLMKVAPRVANWPIQIDDTPSLGILELRAKARRMASQKNVQLIGVDYLQLMHGSRDYSGNRALEVAEISGGLKALAKELNVPMVVLSQLNREVERQKNRKPQLADLRESGAIEQDCDLAALLYRPKSKDKNEEDDDRAPVIRVNAHIAKQRNGPTGDVELLFRRELMHFEDAYANRGALPTDKELGISTVKTNPINPPL